MKTPIANVMSTASFARWAAQMGLRPASVSLIQRIRTTEPFRRTKGRCNVRGSYPSTKMGRTIQFESHRGELPAILEFEHDVHVREFWDQPGQIKLTYQRQTGGNGGHLHVPDFFVIGDTFAGWVECKTADEIKDLAAERPSLYVRTDEGAWTCPPGEAYAAQFGLTYRLYIAGRKGAALTRNLTFLDDYFRREYPAPSSSLVESVLKAIRQSQGITYPALLAKVKQLTEDDLNFLISRGTIYTDLRNVVLADAESATLFTDRATAESIAAVQRAQNPVPVASGGPIELVPTAKICVNSTELTVTHVDDNVVQLLSRDGKIEHLKRTDLEQQIFDGEVCAISTPDLRGRAAAAILNSASPNHLKVAVERWKIIQPYLNPNADSSPRRVPRTKERSIRRWVRNYREALEVQGNGFLGLLPKVRTGYSGSHLDPEVETLMSDLIENDFETVTNKSVSHVHGKLQLACEARGLDVPSLKTFSLRIRQRPQYEQEKKRKGPRASYQRRKFHYFLDLHTPVHGDRPWEIGHIDHTELDIELICPKTGRNLGRPWLTLLMDARTRRIWAISVSFFSESSESCMRILRECVRRHHRLPQILVVDNGKAFDSIYFEALLGHFGITKKSRPSAHPRHGSVCERLFGVINSQFVHNLVGNTQLTKNVRQLTKSIDPKVHAVWTLEALTTRLSEYCFEVYENASHPALGESPRAATARILKETGLRQHTYIPYDRVFHILTLPTTKLGFAKVHPQKGVHLNYLDYWAKAFTDEVAEGTKVHVRYDPWNASVAFAFVAGKWVDCVSSYANVFCNWSQRAIEFASAEFRARNKKHGQTKSVTARQLADFMQVITSHEDMLSLRAREKGSYAAPILSAVPTDSDGISTQPNTFTQETTPNQDETAEDQGVFNVTEE